QDVELWLDPMPGRRRREVLRELRTNLADAAQDVGMARAIEDLGKPRALARSYLDTEPRRRPSWSLGVLGAGAVLAVALLALMAYAAGMADTLLATGGGTATGGFLGLRVVTEASENGLGWEGSGGGCGPPPAGRRGRRRPAESGGPPRAAGGGGAALASPAGTRASAVMISGVRP